MYCTALERILTLFTTHNHEFKNRHFKIFTGNSLISQLPGSVWFVNESFRSGFWTDLLKRSDIKEWRYFFNKKRQVHMSHGPLLLYFYGIYLSFWSLTAWHFHYSQKRGQDILQDYIFCVLRKNKMFPHERSLPSLLYCPCIFFLQNNLWLNLSLNLIDIIDTLYCWAAPGKTIQFLNIFIIIMC